MARTLLPAHVSEYRAHGHSDAMAHIRGELIHNLAANRLEECPLCRRHVESHSALGQEYHDAWYMMMTLVATGRVDPASYVQNIQTGSWMISHAPQERQT